MLNNTYEMAKVFQKISEVYRKKSENRGVSPEERKEESMVVTRCEKDMF